MSGVGDAATMAFDAVGDVSSWTGDLISGGVGMVAGPSTSGFVGDVAGSALTQAAVGAGVGAGVSALTGGDPVKGAMWGGGAGAVTGGLTGLSNNLNSSTSMTLSGVDPDLPGSTGSTTSGAPTDPTVGFDAEAPGVTFDGGGNGGMLPAGTDRSNAISGNIGNVGTADYSFGAPEVFDESAGGVTATGGQAPASRADVAGGGRTAARGAQASSSGGSGFLGGLMNSEVAGTALAAGAGGLLQGMAAEDRAEAAMERDQAAERRTRENYRTSQGRGLLSMDQRRQQRSAAPQSSQFGGRYQYNRETGQIELVPTG